MALARLASSLLLFLLLCGCDTEPNRGLDRPHPKASQCIMGSVMAMSPGCLDGEGGDMTIQAGNREIPIIIRKNTKIHVTTEDVIYFNVVVCGEWVGESFVATEVKKHEEGN